MAAPKRKKAVSEFLSKGAAGSDNFAEVGQHFLQIVGGPRNMAKMLYDEMLEAKQGGMVRARILDLIIQAMKFTYVKQPPKDNMDLMTDDELEAELNSQLAKIQTDETNGQEDERKADANPGNTGVNVAGAAEGAGAAPVGPGS